MNTAMLGATGSVGSRILAELIRRGHTVTAIARDPDRLPSGFGLTRERGDINDGAALVQLLRGHDAVVSAVNFTASSPDQLIAAVRESGVKRYIVVGGAGSLEVAPGMKLIDTPDFPAEYKRESEAGCAFLDKLQHASDLEWTFLSPSAFFEPGKATGVFRLGHNHLLSNEQGSRISFEDYAIALVDELEKPAHIRERFTVGY